jgi:hypothetical protein
MHFIQFSSKCLLLFLLNDMIKKWFDSSGLLKYNQTVCGICIYICIRLASSIYKYLQSTLPGHGLLQHNQKMSYFHKWILTLLCRRR